MAAFSRLSDPAKVVAWAGQLVRDLTKAIRSVSFGTFTLTPAQTTTVISDSACRSGSHITLTAQTANAAGALATTFIGAADVADGSFTVRHGSATSADRTFSYAVFEPSGRTR
ncbi:MAG: hypothetical protein R3F54_28710 [Alphaproteobacteria bacterium]